MLTAVVAVVLLAAVFGLALAASADHPQTDEDLLAERINNLLPQTQCGQCGFAGCRPYAEAVRRHEAAIDQCPPGGRETVAALANLLGRDTVTVRDLAPRADTEAVAWIDEALCIGCARCIRACPVDAILGAPRKMHTVIAAECTGCQLCIDPCPVDCIDMAPPPPDTRDWRRIPPVPPAAGSGREAWRDD